MARVCCATESSVPSDGRKPVPPSAVRLRNPASGIWTSVTAGIALSGGSCQVVYPICVWSIMWFQRPFSNLWLYSSLNAASLAKSRRVSAAVGVGAKNGERHGITGCLKLHKLGANAVGTVQIDLPLTVFP